MVENLFHAYVSDILLLRLLAGTLQKLWADGGVPRFYRGFSPCLMRAIPANGVMLVTVDKVNVLLNKL